MKINKNSIILVSLSVVFCTNVFAQNAQVTINPQTNATQLVIPINPNLALQAPWIMNNVRNLEQLNKKTPSNVEPKVEKNVKAEKTEEVKVEKVEVAAKQETPVVEDKVTVPTVSKPMGQIAIDNPIIVTNDIRLWNTSSIKEKEQQGRVQMMESYRNK